MLLYLSAFLDQVSIYPELISSNIFASSPFLDMPFLVLSSYLEVGTTSSEPQTLSVMVAGGGPCHGHFISTAVLRLPSSETFSNIRGFNHTFSHVRQCQCIMGTTISPLSSSPLHSQRDKGITTTPFPLNLWADIFSVPNSASLSVNIYPNSHTALHLFVYSWMLHA